MVSWLILLVIGLPWLGAAAAFFIRDAQPRVLNTLAVVVSAVSAACAVALLPFATSEVALSLPVGGIFGNFTFVPDGMAVVLAIIATVIGSLAVIFSINYMEGETQLGRYYALVLLFIGAMCGLVLTSSLLLLFFFWEITALCSYALIAFENDNPKAVEGGLKALIITQFGGVGLLGGALIAYSALGTYDIPVFLAQAQTLAPGLLAVMAFGFLAAAAAKSAQLPFHTWLPSAMEAPTPISALIHAATMVNAGVYLLARFYPAFEAVPGWTTAVVIVGALTALLAAIMAIVSNDLKEVLAYSTVSQLGYMVYGIGVGGVLAAQFHLLSHAVFKALLFLGAGAVIHAIGTRDIRKMGGLGKEMPLVRTVFIIGALALAGIPPIFNGFWSKDMILEAGAVGGPTWAYVVMLVVAGLTALYSFRMVWTVFYGERRSTTHVHDAPTAMRVALIPLALGTVTTWLLIGPFGRLYGETLPTHHLHIVDLGEMAAGALAQIAIVLPVIALGLLAFWFRDRLSGITRNLGWLAALARADFGFELANRAIVGATRGAASVIRGTQTGQLNWNAVGIVAGLALVLAVLALR
ncbi:MAG: NADH-quinone oxidoreductase subunit L [Aggregatilineales bacterium]|nr:NADH-quinone oxidoreductase subunit L [Chloroflexota bacterium]HLV43810.1 NADH-quinone oxidoreductase subunit L [Aggregatilineales bacterium]HOA24783.1 NADH-quinone oxidoreductase subunit L [Aggregatilineales bacterium]HQE18557.1 NADH-quinone oxidoreductase subunit L [Aggregatilineales bacterium]